MRSASSPIAGAGDDLDVVFHLQQCGQRAQHHGLVFGNDHADLVALGARHVLSFAERRRPGRVANE